MITIEKEVLMKIFEAEKEAEKMILNAKNEAEKIISAALSNADNNILKTKKDTEVQLAKAPEKAFLSVEHTIEEIKGNLDKKLHEIEEVALKNKEAAIDAVVRKVVGI